MSQDLHVMLAEYRAGLEAEMALLRQLDALALRQTAAAASGDAGLLRGIYEARDGVMQSLVSVEHEMVSLRATLAEARQALARNREFQQVVALHAEAAQMVTRIIASDQQSMAALEAAELARRSAASAMEKGETTLQAYRRVIAPAATNAALVNRRG